MVTKKNRYDLSCWMLDKVYHAPFYT